MKTIDEASVSSPQKQGFFRREISEWFHNTIGDLWGGAVTTFALLPEVIGFMIVVGVHPYMGLFTSICLTILLAFMGGRPGMISAGAGSTALILASLIKQHGLTHPEYIFGAVLLAGAFQFILGVCRVGSLVKFIPQSVINGFVNGFAIVILVSQLKLCIGRSLEMYLLIAAGIGIILLFPLLKKPLPFLKKVPESFVAIVLITAYALIFHSNVTNIGDMGSVTASFQFVGYVFTHLGGMFSAECLSAIFPAALSIAFVGLIESMLTARMVDEETKTDSNKNRECRALGVGNMVCGVLGAMPGCGMIAMTVTNLKSGGKGRLSQFVSGALMAALLFTLSFVMASIPLAALCAVMFVVCFHTVNWDSVIHINRVPVKESVVMAMTFLVIIATDNLAIGFGAGIAFTAILYGFHKIGNGAVQLGISIACLATAIAAGISGLFGFNWGYVIALGLAALGVGAASMTRNESGRANLRTISTVLMVACIAVGVASAVGASIGLHMGPWFALMDAAQETAGESMLYVPAIQ